MKWFIERMDVDGGWLEESDITMTLKGYDPTGIGIPFSGTSFKELERRINEAFNSMEQYSVEQLKVQELSEPTNLNRFKRMTAEELARTLHGFCPYNCFSYCFKCECEEDCVECRKAYLNERSEQ